MRLSTELPRRLSRERSQPSVPHSFERSSRPHSFEFFTSSKDIERQFETGFAESAGLATLAGIPAADNSCRIYKVTIMLLLSVMILLVSLHVQLDECRPKASRGLGILLVTAMWWFSEVVPLSISSLFPIILFPVMGVVPAGILSGKFFFSTSFLLMAGEFVGLAVERWGLHSYFAYKVIASTGDRMEFVIGAFMLAVWLLSMWMSNTTAMLCMLPVTQAFLDALPAGNDDFKAAFLLAIGYSATIGGLATPVGTPANCIFIEFFDLFWESTGQPEFTFTDFFVVALPMSTLMIVVAWLCFCISYIWLRKEKVTSNPQLFQELRAELGPMTYEQWVVLIDAVLLIVLWITGSPINASFMHFPGWKELVAPDMNSGSIGVMLSIPLFFIPCGAVLPPSLQKWLGKHGVQYYDHRARTADDRLADEPPPQRILDWQWVKDGFRWEILFVFGGCAMIAHGTTESGLAAYLAEVDPIVNAPEFSYVLVATVVVSFCTEVVNNMSTLAIFGVIIAADAVQKGYDPVRLLLCVCFSSSYAFMLPLAGGPNMVVYSTGKVDSRFMLRKGLFSKVVAIIISSLYITFVSPHLMEDYHHLPPPLPILREHGYNCSNSTDPLISMFV